MCKQRCCSVGEASPSQSVTKACGAGCASAAFLALPLTCCLWWTCALGRNLGSGVSCGAGGRRRVLEHWGDVDRDPNCHRLRFHKCWHAPHRVRAHGCIPPEPWWVMLYWAKNLPVQNCHTRQALCILGPWCLEVVLWFSVWSKSHSLTPTWSVLPVSPQVTGGRQGS